MFNCQNKSGREEAAASAGQSGARSGRDLLAFKPWTSDEPDFCSIRAGSVPSRQRAGVFRADAESQLCQHLLDLTHHNELLHKLYASTQ